LKTKLQLLIAIFLIAASTLSAQEGDIVTMKTENT